MTRVFMAICCVSIGLAFASCIDASSSAEHQRLSSAMCTEDATPIDPEHPNPFALPACDKACDTVLDCGIDACAGYSWSNAGALSDACLQICQNDWADTILAADGCSAVLDAARLEISALNDFCDSNPCESSCGYLSGCIVAECAAIDAAAQSDLQQGCTNNCDPELSGWVYDYASCTELVEALRENDVNFQAWCDGSGAGTCPGDGTCAPYASKFSACLIDQCNGNADIFEQGIQELMHIDCRFGENCPSESEAQNFLEPTLTCDTLAGIGSNPPFAAFCDGSATPPSTTQAVCAALRTCPEAQWLPSDNACNAFLNILPDISTRITCLEAAGTDCAALLACTGDNG